MGVLPTSEKPSDPSVLGGVLWLLLILLLLSVLLVLLMGVTGGRVVMGAVDGVLVVLCEDEVSDCSDTAAVLCTSRVEEDEMSDTSEFSALLAAVDAAGDCLDCIPAPLLLP